MTDNNRQSVEPPAAGKTVAPFLEIAPLVVYFLAYVGAGWLELVDTQPLFVATAAFIAATAIAVAASVVCSGKIPVMPLASAVPLIILGGAGLLLHDETFIKIRPTAINLLFAATLLGGLAFKKALLRYVFGVMIQISDDGWRQLTLRWGLFCLFMGLTNEFVWRAFPEPIWVIYDAWISTALTLLFTVLQYPLVLRHEERR